MQLKRTIIALISAFATLSMAAFDEDDFSSGVFVLNEDWYGHQNSTINMWYPDDTTDPDNPVYYRVFQSVNAGMEIGCTAQYAQNFGGKIYIMAKQHKDPGANIAGGRLTVVDAATMRCIAQFPVINPNGYVADEGSHHRHRTRRRSRMLRRDTRKGLSRHFQRHIHFRHPGHADYRTHPRH